MKLTLPGLSVVLAAALAAACGGADQNTTNNGGSGGSGASTSTGGKDTGGGDTGGGNTGGTNTGGSSTGGGDTGGTNTGSTNTGGTGGTNTGGGETGGSSTGGNTGGGNTGGGGGGELPCGGFVGETCAEGSYCKYDEGTCGNGDGTGTCVDMPGNCPPDLFDPVCGCDGQVYANACGAAAAGVDLSILGGCAPPGGLFACGAGFCDMAQEYCEVQVSDVVGIPSTYKCLPLPAGCQVNGATCDCLANQLCGDLCKQTDGGFTLTCPGG
jgi:hypothetical protein